MTPIRGTPRRRHATAAAALALAAALAGCGDPPSPGTAGAAPRSAAGGAGPALPRLVDLGSRGCVPCKAMAPILEGLQREYAGRLEVRFIDVRTEPEAAEPFRIRVMPTQIFFGADGRELARHEGFIDREQILARWKSLGVAL